MTRLVKDKSSTAPIVPTVTVTVEPPSPKTSVTEIIEEEVNEIIDNQHYQQTQQANNNNKPVIIDNNKKNEIILEKGSVMNGIVPNVSAMNEERTTYWTTQALLNDNSQKIKEVQLLFLLTHLNFADFLVTSQIFQFYMLPRYGNEICSLGTIINVSPIQDYILRFGEDERPYS